MLAIIIIFQQSHKTLQALQEIMLVYRRLLTLQALVNNALTWQTGGPTPTKIVYEIPNPMVFLERFQIPNQDSRFRTKRFQLIPKQYAKNIRKYPELDRNNSADLLIIMHRNIRRNPRSLRIYSKNS